MCQATLPDFSALERHYLQRSQLLAPCMACRKSGATAGNVVIDAGFETDPGVSHLNPVALGNAQCSCVLATQFKKAGIDQFLDTWTKGAQFLTAENFLSRHQLPAT